MCMVRWSATYWRDEIIALLGILWLSGPASKSAQVSREASAPGPLRACPRADAHRLVCILFNAGPLSAVSQLRFRVGEISRNALVPARREFEPGASARRPIGRTRILNDDTVLTQVFA